MKHEEQTENHPIYRWAHADIAAREAQIVDADDFGKVSWQQDNNSFHLLADIGLWIDLTGHLTAKLTQASHTDTTWYTVLEADIASGESWSFDVLVTGYNVGSGLQWAYSIAGYAMNHGGTTTASGVINERSEGDAAYETRVNADDGNDRVQIQVRRNGGSDYSIDWAARMIAAVS